MPGHSAHTMVAAGTCLFGLYLMPTNAIVVVAGKTRASG